MIRGQHIHIAKKIFTYIFTFAVLISVGCMSFAGALLFSPSILLAFIAFFCAGVPEGEVYKQNIIKGMKELKYIGPNAFAHFKNRKKYQKKKYENIDDNTLKNKILFLRLSIPINMFASIGSAFATAYGLQTTLMTLSIKFGFIISTTALSACIWPLAILAAIGYGFLIYHTICDMVKNDFFNKWYNKLKEWFAQKKDETNLHHALRVTALCFLMAAVVALGVCATLGTAGTWWFAVKNSASILIPIASVANAIRNILVPIVASTQLIFTLKNSLETIKSLLKISPSESFKMIKNKMAKMYAEESWLQIFNPFRLITTPLLLIFRYVVFIGHLISMGFSGDHVGSIPPAITTSINGLNDGLQDLHCFLPIIENNELEKPQKKQQNDQHEIENLVELPLIILLSPFLLLGNWWNDAFKAPKPSEPASFSYTAPTQRFFMEYCHPVSSQQSRKPITNASLQE